MHKMNNLEYSFIVTELTPKVVGRHFNRIRKISDNIYRLKIGSTEIICELGVRLHETMLIEKTEQTDKFVEKAGKELDNAKLTSIIQVNRDRIVSFVFDNTTLVFEMFGEGNAILVRDGLTITAARFESWSDREIKVGSPYSPPKSAPSKSLEVSDKYIIASLMRLPIGKEYAIEALARLGIDEKEKGNSLSGNRILALEQELSRIETDAKPVAFFDNENGKEKMVDFALAPLHRYQAAIKKEFPSLSAVADEYYSKAEKPNPLLEKLLNRLEKQQERLLELRAEESANKEAGDLIYSKYQEIEHILALAKEGKFEELEKSHAGKADKKEKSVEVEL